MYGGKLLLNKTDFVELKITSPPKYLSQSLKLHCYCQTFPGGVPDYAVCSDLQQALSFFSCK